MASLLVLQLVPRDLFDLALRIKAAVDEVHQNTDGLKRIAEELHQDLQRLCNHACNPRASQIEAKLSYELSYLRGELFKYLAQIQALVNERSIFRKLVRRSQIRDAIQGARQAVDRCYQRFIAAATIYAVQGLGDLKSKVDRLSYEHPSRHTRSRANFADRKISSEENARVKYSPPPAYESRQNSASSDSTLVGSDDMTQLSMRVEYMLRRHNYPKVKSTRSRRHPSLSRGDHPVVISHSNRHSSPQDYISQSHKCVDDLIRLDWAASISVTASLLSQLSISLCDLDLQNAACKVAEACVDLYHELALTSRGYLAPYAHSLDIYSTLLTAMHADPELAFDQSNRAVILFEYLQVHYPGKHAASLSSALTNHSNSLCGLGEYAQALQIILQSVEIRRGLYSSDSQVTSSLCCALHNLAQCLLDVGDAYSAQSALSIISETVELVHILVRGNPVFMHVLATCLLTYSHCHMRHGSHEESIRAAQQALHIRRTCILSPGVQRNALLAEAYSHLSSCYNMSATDDSSKAFSAISGAIALQRALLHGTENSSKALDTLAYYLYRSAMLLSRLGEPRRAIQAIQESVIHREQLVLTSPTQEQQADLSQSLHDLGVLLHNHRQYHDAEVAMQKAIRIRRALALSDRSQFLRFLRNSEDALLVIKESCSS